MTGVSTFKPHPEPKRLTHEIPKAKIQSERMPKFGIILSHKTDCAVELFKWRARSHMFSFQKHKKSLVFTENNNTLVFC